MKHIKIIGLAALAMALMAVVASSASAAKICSTAGTGAACGAGHGKVYTGSIVGKNVGNVVLTVTSSEAKDINTVTCTTSEAGGTITNGETGVGSINKMTFTGCSSNICSSVTASTNAATSPWASETATETAVENTNGFMTSKNVTGTFVCTFLGFPVTCKYSAATAKTRIQGSDTEPKIIASGVTLTTEESSNASVCGATAHWTGTYRITTPSSLFVE
jgi:hypothetical protein